MITRRNIASNPRGATATGGWASNPGTSGTNAVSVVGAGGPNSDIPTFARALWSVAETASNGSLLLGTSIANAAEQKVTPGDVVTVSCYVRTSIANATVYCRVNTYDAAGAFMGAGPLVGSNNVLVANTWTRISVVGTIVAGAVRMTAGAQQTTGTGLMGVNDTLDVTGVLIEVNAPSAIGAYFDGSTLSADKTQKFSWDGTVHSSSSRQELLPNVARKNFCPNPSFEVNTTGWVTGSTALTNTGGTLTRDTSIFDVGVASGKVVCDGAATQQGASVLLTYLKPNTTYTVSAWLKSVSGRPLMLRTRDTVNLINGVTANVASGNTARVSSTITTGPTGPAAILVGISTDFTAAASTFNFDTVLIEEGATAGTYFDGSTAWDNNYKYSWYGAASNSESLLEPLSVSVRRNRAPNPIVSTATTNWSNNGAGGAVTMARITGSGSPVADTACRLTWTADATQDLGGIYHGGAGRIIAAVPGSCVASAYVRPSKSQRMVLLVYAYDSAGTLISGSPFNDQPVVIPGNTWTRISSTVTLPLNTDRLLVAAYSTTGTGLVRWVTGDTIDVTGMLVETGISVLGSYFDGSLPWSTYKYSWAGSANGSESFAEPVSVSRRNYVLNPIGLYPVATGWWIATGGTLAVKDDALRLTFTAGTSGALDQKIGCSIDANTGMACVPGDIFTFAIEARSNLTVPMALNFNWQNAAGASVGGVNSPTVVLDPATYKRLTFTATAPANAAFFSVQCGLWTGTKNVNDWFECRRAIVEKGSSVGTYFDGNTLSDASTEYAWQGAVNNSSSYAIASISNAGKASDMFQQLVNAGFGPGTLVDMEYKRLLSKAGLTYPQKLSLYDLYALTGERPRIAAFRK